MTTESAQPSGSGQAPTSGASGAASAGPEIERRFIVKTVPDLSGLKGVEIIQGYLAAERDRAVRLRWTEGKFYQTVKLGTGTKRAEIECEISREQFDVLWPATEGRRLEKTRYRIPYETSTIELDVFHEDLEGLVIAEVEFRSTEDSALFQPPPWFDREVTEEPRFENERLAINGMPKSLRDIHYHFKGHEKISDGVRRLVLEQIDEALDHLETRGPEIDEAIHDVRVCFKKIRAVLRLVRGEIGEHVFKEENGRFRDAGHRLSAVRDSVVVIDTFDELTKHMSWLTGGEIQQLRSRLVQVERTPQHEKERALAEVASVVTAARERVQEWPIDHQGFAALNPGLRAVYRQGRANFKVVLNRPTTRNLHELRKRVKDLSYETRVLRSAWPRMLKSFSGELKELASLLNEDHDLAMLREALCNEPDIRSGADLWEPVVTLIDRRREELEAQARPLAQRVYVEKPGSFVRRIRGYWVAWRSQIA